MSQFNFEGQPEGDWEDRGEITWMEQDWQLFLKRREDEIVRFLKFYNNCPPDESQRLDWVAARMKWDAEDWSVADGDLLDDDDEDTGELKDEDPYTLHRHPVFVVAIGLFTQIRYFWRNDLLKQGNRIDPVASWDFGDSLTEAERHCLLAMQSMEMGDFLLCIVHFKRCLRGVNLAMGHLGTIRAGGPAPDNLSRSISDRLFDIREVALRIMADCRENEKGDLLDGE